MAATSDDHLPYGRVKKYPYIIERRMGSPAEDEAKYDSTHPRAGGKPRAEHESFNSLEMYAQGQGIDCASG